MLKIYFDCNRNLIFVTWKQNLRHGASLGSKIVVGLNIVLQSIDNHIVVVAFTMYSVHKFPGTSIPIFIPIGIEPGIDHWVCGSFHELMSYCCNGRIHSSITIWRCTLSKAVAIRSRDTNPAVLVVSTVTVPATKLGAETRLIYITKRSRKIVTF